MSQSPVKQFTAMFKARTMEFLRDRGTLLWNLFFPVIMIVGLAFAFGGNNDKIFKIGVLGPVDSVPALLKIEQADFIAYDTTPEGREKALTRLRQHQIDLLLEPASRHYFLNGESGKSRLLQKLYEGEWVKATASGSADSAVMYSQEAVTGKAVRYADWLIPGVIGMNMMFSCLFGVGFVIVRYRKNGVLKRLKATPVSALNFVLAQGVSRFLIVLVTMIVVYTGTNLLLGFTMLGSYFDLLLLASLSILAMIALGLVFASRFRSEELANGLMNLLTFPMMLLSGVFVPLDIMPGWLQGVSQALPLTHFTEGARKIMLDGGNLLTIAPDMLYLGLMTAGLMALAAWLFKWE